MFNNYPLLFPPVVYAAGIIALSVSATLWCLRRFKEMPGDEPAPTPHSDPAERVFPDLLDDRRDGWQRGVESD